MGIFGYDSVGDMFDGGGPGRSGDRFEGGGFASTIGNALGGPSAFSGSGSGSSFDDWVDGRAPGGARGGERPKPRQPNYDRAFRRADEFWSPIRDAIRGNYSSYGSSPEDFDFSEWEEKIGSLGLENFYDVLDTPENENLFVQYQDQIANLTPTGPFDPFKGIDAFPGIDLMGDPRTGEFSIVGPQLGQWEDYFDGVGNYWYTPHPSLSRIRRSHRVNARPETKRGVSWGDYENVNGAHVIHLDGFGRLAGSATSDAVSGIQSMLDNSLGIRDRAEQAVRDRVSSFSDTMLDLQDQSAGLGLGDWRQVEQLRNRFDTAMSEFENFDSPLMDADWRAARGIDLGVDPDAVMDQWRGSVGGTLDDLYQQYEDEQGRISSFEDNLWSSADNLMAQIAGMSFADEAGIESVQDEIRRLRREAGRFDSELGFDFSDELGAAGLGAAEADLNDLLRERLDEEMRISEARSGFANRADSLLSRLQTGNFDNLQDLEQLRSRADLLRDEVTGFSSELPFDFSSITGTRLADVDAAYANALRSRNRELDRLEGDFGSFMSEAGRLKDYDEQGLRSMLSQLGSLERQAGYFSGGERSEGLYSDITGARGDLQSRLDALYARRDELPVEAQQRLEALRETSFYDLDQVESAMDEWQPFSQTMQQYGLGTDQSLSRALGFLDEERARLEADAANVAARQEQAQATVPQSSGPQFPFYGDGGLIDPVSDDQYRQLLAMLRSFGNRDAVQPYSGYVPFSMSDMIRV